MHAHWREHNRRNQATHLRRSQAVPRRDSRSPAANRRLLPHPAAVKATAADCCYRAAVFARALGRRGDGGARRRRRWRRSQWREGDNFECRFVLPCRKQKNVSLFCIWALRSYLLCKIGVLPLRFDPVQFLTVLVKSAINQPNFTWSSNVSCSPFLFLFLFSFSFSFLFPFLLFYSKIFTYFSMNSIFLWPRYWNILLPTYNVVIKKIKYGLKNSNEIFTFLCREFSEGCRKERSQFRIYELYLIYKYETKLVTENYNYTSTFSDNINLDFF